MQDQTATALVVRYLNSVADPHGAGQVTRDDVDTAMRLGGGLPQGPLAGLDELGIDVALAFLGEPCLVPPPALTAHVTAGRLGRETDCGLLSGLHREQVSPTVATGTAAAARDAR
ncbi:hypothetical protein HCA58_08685 [Micromonospora sp. HNM0581]|uniref:3-hydroxyacyl-CoA dehydrogenase family protein n=1 Tax=Micromonospora sp. HNM0581 TaxID=2716341 RepID=UPI00146D2D28|nr:3-hydroxyacyl-CoA dehydrogenase family protein [Micromonospora sp. HNM0581]NLU78454.1 hypothetical protein [Micromonospora sp. HNM0581]